ncbi:lipase maturation factor 2-like [Schistocerca nitens]|uniref:lipase maturation factor 2-like n=1 Tax=Schistocerca nitens TaxID=7011 RepID=UPI0021189973|nr:lipase maturation factor 2-like [Schistocerca nitens]
MANIRYTRNLFLRGMSVVYLFALASLYVQIPGLYGKNGLLPAENQLDSKASALAARIHTKPTLLWLAPYVGLDTEYMMDVLTIFGIFLAFTGFVSQKFCTAPTFAALWSLYYSLYQVGQTFMWFQWDILLLEAGFLSILVAPLRYRPISRRRSTPIQAPSDTIAFWLVKWLLFRLMFQSGVVKLTSGCPTWWGLTALTVHFESQCIPTPLAWYAHHLPRWFLKLTCVGANIAEIPLPLLFFVPVRSVRVVAFYIQLFLQVCIILTGNYNFFNLLTIVLCLSLLDDDFFLKKKPQKGASNFWPGLFSKAVTLVVYAALLYSTVVWYSLRITPKNTIESDIAFTRQQFDQALSKAVPLTIYVGLASLGLVIVEAVSTALVESQTFARRAVTVLTTLLYAAAALFIFAISTVPYSTLHPSGNSTVLPTVRTWESRINHLHVTNAYGLFRRMTGVGGRPEVIIEGSNHIDGPWQEYNFLYKAGNVNATPPFVAPHQPRVDWQMWFAALGTYHQNPWLMSLAYRLLNGQPEVLQLLDTSRNPFPNKPPKYIRATLYHYHYTPWTQRSASAWWTRERVGEYFPIFSRDHPPLLEYLRNVKILTDSRKDPTVIPWLKMLLDRLRKLATAVDPAILMWSLFTAGCAIVAGSASSGSRK